MLIEAPSKLRDSSLPASEFALAKRRRRGANLAGQLPRRLPRRLVRSQLLLLQRLGLLLFHLPLLGDLFPTCLLVTGPDSYARRVLAAAGSILSLPRRRRRQETRVNRTELLRVAKNLKGGSLQTAHDRRAQLFKRLAFVGFDLDRL